MGADLPDGRKSVDSGSLSDTRCRKKEFQWECWRPKLPMSGEPKVIQMGRHLLSLFMLLSRNKVKRDAIDPPRDCPVMIN